MHTFDHSSPSLAFWGAQNCVNFRDTDEWRFFVCSQMFFYTSVLRYWVNLFLYTIIWNVRRTYFEARTFKEIYNIDFSPRHKIIHVLFVSCWENENLLVHFLGGLLYQLLRHFILLLSTYVPGKICRGCLSDVLSLLNYGFTLLWPRQFSTGGLGSLLSNRVKRK